MKIHFPGLNSVRFIAATMVIVSHIESFKAQKGYANLVDVAFISTIGQHGVKIFFTLSGFLIGYLLLAEFDLKGKIDVKDFYIRRALRIWPLYYLIIILGLVVLPAVIHHTFLSGNVRDDVTEKTLLSVFFLPNVMQHYYGHILGLGVLWSIGVEEQFYLFFPWLLRASVKNFGKIILWSIVFIVAGKLCIALLIPTYFPAYQDTFLMISKAFLQFDAMFIGVLFAVIYKNRSSIISFLFKTSTQIIAIVIAAALMWWSPVELFMPTEWAYAFSNVLYAIPFGLLILNIAANEGSLLKLRINLLDTAGKWSYGMYMYHSIIVYILVAYGARYLSGRPVLMNVFLYFGAIIATVVVSYISFTYFENWFLKMKKRFSAIVSES